MELFPHTRAAITPRDYQIEDHDETFRLWDKGNVGTLTRLATGMGKSICTCLKMDTWLKRGSDYHCMVLSYEKQLVWQFAEEIEDVLGIKPAIEMEKETVNPSHGMPNIVVASRQTLSLHKPPNEEQLMRLADYGVDELGACSRIHAKKFLKVLDAGYDVAIVQDEIMRLNEQPEAHNGKWSRLHKFDFNLNWAIFADEAHKFAHKLATVGHVFDWFGQNPIHRRNGNTATPKRSDAVSIGHKSFPAIAIDIPLYSANSRCAVKEGWAVPYVQKYVSVEGVDFKQLSRIGNDFDESELERVLGTEEKLAEMLFPTMELAGNRRTLVFVPTVEMCKNVVSYCNARVRCKCPDPDFDPTGCGKESWQSSRLIGDGAQCDCGYFFEDHHVVSSGRIADFCVGSIPHEERRRIYSQHQAGDFQFLVVCGLCREGYNDREISCVAVLRPVSEKASSLAEQMKGRSCRPLPGLVDGLDTAEERVSAIAASDKPNSLIIDLVGITGLADCASTVLIYADGEPDEVIERAEELLLEGMDDVEEAVQQAKDEREAAKEKARLEREAAEERARREAEERAKLDGRAKYETHDVGPKSAALPKGACSEAQLRFLKFLGLHIHGIEPSRKQAGRMISQLKEGVPLDEVARTNRIPDEAWSPSLPSVKQIRFAEMKGVRLPQGLTPKQVSMRIDARVNPSSFVEAIGECTSHESLDFVRGEIANHGWQQLDGADKNAIINAGLEKRDSLGGTEDWT